MALPQITVTEFEFETLLKASDVKLVTVVRDKIRRNNPLPQRFKSDRCKILERTPERIKIALKIGEETVGYFNFVPTRKLS